MGKEILTGRAVSTCGLQDETNDNRTHLINYAVYQHMVTEETLFQYRKNNKRTWHEPDVKIVNQTDHVMIDQRHRSNILDVRSYRVANADSYHYLVIAQLSCCIAQRNNQNMPKA
jgi:hypothetical protein